jgi:hypothetical protein
MDGMDGWPCNIRDEHLIDIVQRTRPWVIGNWAFTTVNLTTDLPTTLHRLSNKSTINKHPCRCKNSDAELPVHVRTLVKQPLPSPASARDFAEAITPHTLDLMIAFAVASLTVGIVGFAVVACYFLNSGPSTVTTSNIFARVAACTAYVRHRVQIRC